MSQLSQIDFDYVRKLVYTTSAIALEPGKGYLAEVRLGALARQEGLASARDLVARLRAGEAENLRLKVVEAMTTNETSFFRDVHPFEALRLRVLPELIRLRAAERQLCIWSAACSSGQEPYSLAILLREHFPQVASNWTIRLIASDLSREMVERARAGRFSQMEVNRGVPASLLIKYFHRQGLEWRVDDAVRRMVEFRPLNLVGPWPALPPMDLILLRNVLLYFDTETKRAVLTRAAEQLRGDGFLLMGGAESPLFLHDGFDRADQGPSSLYRLRRAPGREGDPGADRHHE